MCNVQCAMSQFMLEKVGLAVMGMWQKAAWVWVGEGLVPGHPLPQLVQARHHSRKSYQLPPGCHLMRRGFEAGHGFLRGSRILKLMGHLHAQQRNYCHSTNIDIHHLMSRTCSDTWRIDVTASLGDCSRIIDWLIV